MHLGEGEIDAPWLLRELDRAGYSGDIALEYEVNEIEPPETGLARWRAVCEALCGCRGRLRPASRPEVPPLNRQKSGST